MLYFARHFFYVAACNSLLKIAGNALLQPPLPTIKNKQLHVASSVPIPSLAARLKLWDYMRLCFIPALVVDAFAITGDGNNAR